MKQITIRRLANTGFNSVYIDFLLNKNCDNKMIQLILSLAVVFINSSDKDIFELGYRIIVIYSNRYHDYKPLYDISINKGLIPISSFIENKIFENSTNLSIELNRIYSQQFCFNDIYLSFQQIEMNRFYFQNTHDSVAIVAPTSYGKTDLIIQSINNCKGNIVIITPTKSLLSQTKSRILHSKIKDDIKIITHPDMITSIDKRIIAILTQERLLKLLNEYNIVFETVIVDEAHTLLSNSKRSQLLADVLIILNKRNNSTNFKLLTPFLVDANNVKIRYFNIQFKPFLIKEKMKTETIFYADFKNEKNEYLYDQYINSFISTNNNLKDYKLYTYIIQNSGKKNIIYLNKPSDVEKFAKDFINDAHLISLKGYKKVSKAMEDIANYLHPKYDLIKYIEYGIVCHHGSIIDPIRYFIEDLFSSYDDISYVITTSTLLEGVNLPADKMFLLSINKGKGYLNRSDFKNLIGRINRFKYIFSDDKNDLQGLESKIYIVEDTFMSENANIKEFIRKVMSVSHQDKDEIKNVMLDRVSINSDNKKELQNNNDFLVNFSKNIDQVNGNYASTEIGNICFKNNLYEIDILKFEIFIASDINNLTQHSLIISEPQVLIKCISDIFLKYSTEDKLKRFEYSETRNFYSMFLVWRITNVSLNEMIMKFVNYWKSLTISRSDEDSIVYVGKWGDTKRNGFRNLWINVKEKTEDQLINLAILRIKEEQDFIDNTLIKYIDVLNDCGLVENSLYKKIKYGSDNSKFIILVNNGFSGGLASLLLKIYSTYLEFDTNEESVILDDHILDKMISDNVNGIYISELRRLI